MNPEAGSYYSKPSDILNTHVSQTLHNMLTRCHDVEEEKGTVGTPAPRAKGRGAVRNACRV